MNNLTNNFVEHIKNLKSSLLKQEDCERQTGRSTRIINQAKYQRSTVVCANYRQKWEFEHLGVEAITLEQYHKEKRELSKTYLFDHLTIYYIMDKHYSQLIEEYQNE